MVIGFAFPGGGRTMGWRKSWRRPWLKLVVIPLFADAAEFFVARWFDWDRERFCTSLGNRSVIPLAWLGLCRLPTGHGAWPTTELGPCLKLIRWALMSAKLRTGFASAQTMTTSASSSTRFRLLK